jgi:hypothetical protein
MWEEKQKIARMVKSSLTFMEPKNSPELAVGLCHEADASTPCTRDLLPQHSF